MTAIEIVEERLLTTGDGGPTSWASARERLSEMRSYWLASLHPAGRAHVRPLLGVVLDDRVYFCTSAHARKGRNIELVPECTITANGRDLDLVVEGTVAKVGTEEQLERVTAAYRAKYGWPVKPAGDGTVTAEYVAPTGGEPPYYLYGLTPKTAFGFPSSEGFGPMRWRFRPASG